MSWWALDHGPVHVLMLNSELEVSVSSPQYAFAERSLRAVNRSRTPWVVVAFHRPMYWVDSGEKDGGGYGGGFEALEPLFVETQVDAVIVGHVHNALVTCPVIAQKCVEPAHPGAYAAPVHVCVGNAGQGLTPIAKQGPVWARYQASEFGMATLDVDSAHVMRINLYADSGEHRYEAVFERE